MTLEQRIEALENAVANLTLPNSKTEELTRMMRDVASETIKNARRSGGMLGQKDRKATEKKVASFIVNSGSAFIQPAKIDGACIGQCHK